MAEAIGTLETLLGNARQLTPCVLAQWRQVKMIVGRVRKKLCGMFVCVP